MFFLEKGSLEGQGAADLFPLPSGYGWSKEDVSVSPSFLRVRAYDQMPPPDSLQGAFNSDLRCSQKPCGVGLIRPHYTNRKLSSDMSVVPKVMPCPSFITQCI